MTFKAGLSRPCLLNEVPREKMRFSPAVDTKGMPNQISGWVPPHTFTERASRAPLHWCAENRTGDLRPRQPGRQRTTSTRWLSRFPTPTGQKRGLPASLSVIAKGDAQRPLLAFFCGFAPFGNYL